MSKSINIHYRYNFYYDDENELTILCIAENFDTEVAFSYIADIKKCFLTTYDNSTIKNSYSYQFKEFSDNIKRISKNYEMNPNSKIQVLKNRLSETSTILKQNVEKLLAKNEKLNIIVQKSRNLNESSDILMRNIKEIKRKQKMKYYKYIAIIVLFFILLFIIIYFTFIK